MTTPTLREAAMAALERFSADAAIDPLDAEAFETIRSYLCEEHEPVPLTDDRIDRIADIVAKGMDGGIAGFCKTWGYRQFARALLEDCRGYYRAAPEQSPADGGQAVAWQECPVDRERFRALARQAGFQPGVGGYIWAGDEIPQADVSDALWDFAKLLKAEYATPAAPTSGEPVAWVISLECDMRGFIDAMAWSEDEFTTPLFTADQLRAAIAADRLACAKARGE